jgi:hypothetical protein
LDRHWAASEAGDDDAEDEIYHDDAVLEYPQSGERIRGRLAIRTTRGLLPDKHFTIRRVLGHGDLWVTVGEPFEPWSGRAQWVEPID